jgi:predicted nucleic acid-binding Zn ribbon protein
MALYSAVCDQCGLVEIIKGMMEPWPEKHGCGGTLRRIFSDVPVHYKASGFRDFDDGLKKSIGPKRFAEFEAKKKRIEDALPRGYRDAVED